jgi:3-deoxy-D-manno-octulosonate 8-phosphate phosphatase (KDO 8-P phosphatase)
VRKPRDAAESRQKAPPETAAPAPIKKASRIPTEAIQPAPEELVQELIQGPLPGPVRIVFMDVDGTLTDGIIGYDGTGDSRHFWIRDGLALQWARDLEVLPVAISGRSSRAVELRLQDLHVEHYLGIQDKVAVAERVLRREKVTWQECVMVGDDLPDVPLLKRVGWPIAVADAVLEVKVVARTVTGQRAGYGAVREVIEMVLKHNGTWEKVLARYEAS